MKRISRRGIRPWLYVSHRGVRFATRWFTLILDRDGLRGKRHV